MFAPSLQLIPSYRTTLRLHHSSYWWCHLPCTPFIIDKRQKLKPFFDFENPIAISADFPLHLEFLEILGIGTEDFFNEEGSCCQVLTAVLGERSMTSKLQAEMIKVLRLKGRVKYFSGHEVCLEISINIDQFWKVKWSQDKWSGERSVK